MYRLVPSLNVLQGGVNVENKNIKNDIPKTGKVEDWRLVFPEIDEASLVFCVYPEEWFQGVFKTPEDKQWSTKASQLFFKGGKIPVNGSLPQEYIQKGLRILNCVLGSWKPKHEHKEHVVGLILKSLCDV
jgi:hypothetical protein